MRRARHAPNGSRTATSRRFPPAFACSRLRGASRGWCMAAMADGAWKNKRLGKWTTAGLSPVLNFPRSSRARTPFARRRSLRPCGRASCACPSFRPRWGQFRPPCAPSRRRASCVSCVAAVCGGPPMASMPPQPLLRPSSRPMASSPHRSPRSRRGRKVPLRPSIARASMPAARWSSSTASPDRARRSSTCAPSRRRSPRGSRPACSCLRSRSLRRRWAASAVASATWSRSCTRA